MHSDDDECELEKQKEHILNSLEQLKKEVRDILDTLEMTPNTTYEEKKLQVSKNLSVHSKNAQVISYEKAELLNKAELGDLLESIDSC